MGAFLTLAAPVDPLAWRRGVLGWEEGCGRRDREVGEKSCRRGKRIMSVIIGGWTSESTVQIVRKLTGAVVWGLCREVVGVRGEGSVGSPGIQFICGSPWE